ncbi:Phosphomannomutase [Candidatus Magnetomoraceae bacterium gMMP-13]
MKSNFSSVAVKKNFKSLNVSEKYINSAIKWLGVWLSDNTFSEYKNQIEYLIEMEKWEFLLDSFYQVIPFGTGGRRGLVGIGPNRINNWTIQASAQGHSQYLLKYYGDDAKKRGVVLAYDVRKYTEKEIYNDNIPNPVMNLDCKQLANAAAEVYTANGIKIFMFDDVRSTPELSFIIRHINAVAGDMFSASHNLPTDNGKKIYDEFGGQLIPPDDQALVNEVSDNVKEIKTLELTTAKEKGLLEYIGKNYDREYYNAVTSVSLSEYRNIKILYSPLHGTGLTSVYPVLKESGFDITLDPKTSYFNSDFENVTFNIPNPEVIESFDSSIPFADEIHADLIMNSDPDADRIGVMVKHKNSWEFLNGNEIGILLTDYGISMLKDKGKINKNSTIIKTEVTSSLIEKIAFKNKINCIGNLLVGFKYIGCQMNLLEKENKINDFILGTEESHGYIMGNYCRDKDAAAAAIWIAELASKLKNSNKTLIDHLNYIYSKYGYCHNYLTEIRLLGAKGKDQITLIMKNLRENSYEKFTDFYVKEKIDRWDGEPQPHLSLTDTWSRDVLVFKIKELDNTQSIRIIVRPSGTEPKIKMYFEVVGKPFNFDGEEIKAEKEKISNIRKKLENAFMKYCYRLLDVDFPDRGFLLFWQLPLNHKMKYFEIEKDIAKLKEISDNKIKINKLNNMLKFLGSNPIEKVDKAFKEKYKTGINEYLEIK